MKLPLLRRPKSFRLDKFLCFFCIIFAFSSCRQSAVEGEQLARKYCGSCHLFPDPALLSKSVWKNSVLPQMAFRMGFADAAIQSKLPRKDMDLVLAAIPASPVISEREYQAIKDFYISNSPDRLAIPEQRIEPLQGFTIRALQGLEGEYVTSLKYDEEQRQLFVGLRSGRLFTVNSELQLTGSGRAASAISDIKVQEDQVWISEMGIMDPSEQAAGRISVWDRSLVGSSVIIDSLQRPVNFYRHDLNGDDLEDYVICNFGNYTGTTLLLQALPDAQYKRLYLNQLPGARTIVIRDLNNDNLPDLLVLMTQGDERVVIYYNEGNFSFREEPVLRFPPVNGSNYMEVADFNGDGYVDLLVANGDNGDYSVVHKPYHGLTLFENDRQNKFKRVWSATLPGASQCKAVDFDQDGDLDIAAISFFPKTDSVSAGSFAYYENTGQYTFVARSLPGVRNARWLVIETGDFDEDSDDDIFLGAFNYNGLGAKELHMQKYNPAYPALLVLENKHSP